MTRSERRRRRSLARRIADGGGVGATKKMMVEGKLMQQIITRRIHLLPFLTLHEKKDKNKRGKVLLHCD